MSLNKILTLSQELRKNGFDKQADELEYKFIVLNKFKKTAATRDEIVDRMVNFFKQRVSGFDEAAIRSRCNNLNANQLEMFEQQLFEFNHGAGNAPRFPDYFGSGAARGAAHVGGAPSATPSPSLPTPHGTPHPSPHTSPGMRPDGTFIVTDSDSAKKAIQHMEANPSTISKYKKLSEAERALIDLEYKSTSWARRGLVGLPGTAARTRAKWLGGLGLGAALGLSLMGDDDEVPQVSPDAPNKPKPEASNKPKPGSKSPSSPTAPKAPSARGTRPAITPRPSTTGNIEAGDLR